MFQMFFSLQLVHEWEIDRSDTLACVRPAGVQGFECTCLHCFVVEVANGRIDKHSVVNVFRGIIIVDQWVDVPFTVEQCKQVIFGIRVRLLNVRCLSSRSVSTAS